MRKIVGHCRGEDGIFLVLWALLLLALLTMVAIVIDLGAVRADRRETRLATDAAATAGAQDLGETRSPAAACTAAWEYAVLNLGFSVSDATSTPTCGNFPVVVCPTVTTRQDEIGTIR